MSAFTRPIIGSTATIPGMEPGSRVRNIRTGEVGTVVAIVEGYGGQPWVAIAFDGRAYRFPADAVHVRPDFLVVVAP